MPDVAATPRRFGERLSRFGERLRSLPPLAVDTGIAVVCYAATVVFPIRLHDGTWWVYALAALATLPLVWRRRFPMMVAAAVGVGTTWLSLADKIDWIPYGSLVATYTFASLSPPVWRLLAAVVTAAGVSVSLLVPGKSLVAVAIVGIPFVTAYALGTGARARRDRIAMLEERGRRLAEEHAAAAARESERIARDMHDILAHSISLIVVQAEAGPVVVRSEPERAVAAFGAIADTGREALTQLRRTLGLLRSDGADREPQPDLDALPALVARARESGLEASLDEYGDRRPVPAELALAAYRIVQESLTNTLKHADASHVSVRLGWRDTALCVEVSDDGRGPRAAAGDGHGLIGMRERVSACGGRLTTGERVDGTGFRVFATLPLAAGNA